MYTPVKLSIFVMLILISLMSFGQGIVHPPELDSIAGASGDLDKDGIEERAIVYRTRDTTDAGVEKELVIYKKINGKWQVWTKSRNAILRSDEGGMMGDPFGDIKIKNGVLIISFEGGSRWKWNYTDKYRYQNNTFRLIGHESFYGTLCEYWQTIDYNLLTGKLIYKKEFESCEKEQAVVKTEAENFKVISPIITIHNRKSGQIKIKTPKYKVELYL